MGHISALMILALCLAVLPAHGQSPFSDIHVEFDGDDVRVHNPGWEWLSSVFDTIGTPSVVSNPYVSGFWSTSWALNWNNRTGVITVRWNDTDSSDYLAGGWWAQEDPAGDFTMITTPFVDGPELRGALPDTMILPLDGEASYSGRVSGVYESQGRTSFDTGEFGAPLAVRAYFDEGQISGCAGCNDGITLTPATYDLATGTITRGTSSTIDYKMTLATAYYLEAPDSLGIFEDDLTVASHAGVSAGSGLWRGRFSNLQDAAGIPRLVAGTLDGDFTYSGSNVYFNGLWFADSPSSRIPDISTPVALADSSVTSEANDR